MIALPQSCLVVKEKTEGKKKSDFVRGEAVGKDMRQKKYCNLHSPKLIFIQSIVALLGFFLCLLILFPLHIPFKYSFFSQWSCIYRHLSHLRAEQQEGENEVLQLKDKSTLICRTSFMGFFSEMFL